MENKILGVLSIMIALYCLFTEIYDIKNRKNKKWKLLSPQDKVMRFFAPIWMSTLFILGIFLLFFTD